MTIKQPLRNKIQPHSQRFLHGAKAFMIAGVAIFILLSLLSYNPDDTPLRTSSVNIPVKNLVGIVGAYIAEGLNISLGWVGYAICFVLLTWAIARFLEKPAPNIYVKLLGTTILLLSLTVLFTLFGPQQEGLRFQRGGAVGTLICGFLVKYFGHIGSLIIGVGLGMLSSLVATEFVILPALKWLGKAILGFILSFKKLGKLIGHLDKSFHLAAFSLGQKKDRLIKAHKVKPAPLLKPEQEVPALKMQRSRPTIEAPKIDRPRPKIVRAMPPKIQASAKAALVPATQSACIDYKLPRLDLLDSPPPLKERQIQDDLQANSQILEATLRDFGVETRVTQVSPGPVITRYELEPAPGVKVHRIVELGDDIALAMKAYSVRIVAPIPGKSRVGIEVPNTQSALVYLKEILGSAEFQNSQSKLTLALGKDISGEAIVTDLSDMPHLLIAGTTGSGKTVCVNSIIVSMLFKASPDELKFIMIDPKMVELAVFNELPHLLCPVLTDAKKVSSALAWVVNEMEERYKLLAKVGARNIDLYNEKIKVDKGIGADAAGQSAESPGESAHPAAEKMPYIIVIIDELADLMVVASQQVENAITRLAQLSRAVGIHLILATQRPSVDVVTGVIKANFPARISFRVASRVDSRTVLDMNGADKLLGKGDLLFLKPGQHKPIRAQGSLISDGEIERIVGFIKKQKPSFYNQALLDAQEKKAGSFRKFERDELFDEAVKIILQTKQASVSMLQRRLGLGYTRAARLIDAMEEEGIVGPYRGSKAREILVDKDNLNQEAEEQINSSSENTF